MGVCQGRIAIVSDTHMPKGTRALPTACVELLRAADLILHAGDFVRTEVLRQLEGYGEVVAVHGNVDEPASGFQLFNPGSPTERRRAPQHTMGIATVADGVVRFEHVVL